MLTFPYRFSIVLFTADGAEPGAGPVECDWEPVHEWTRLQLQRRGLLATCCQSERASVVPVWDERRGEPYCQGLGFEIAQDGRPPVEAEVPNSLLRAQASALAARLVAERRLGAGERYSYRLLAHRAVEAAPAAGRMRVREAAPRMPVEAARIGEFVARARPSGVLDADDLPVFVVQEVLDVFEAQTRQHAGTETGGILIGRLWQDSGAEIFVEVSAVIPLEHTVGSKVKLTFTPEAWTAAEAALRRRGQGEIYLGFAHSHPVYEWCREKGCSAEAQRACVFAKDFFSPDDEGVLRAAFPRAYSIGLVANHTVFDVSFSMFGNRRGVVKARGFYVLGGVDGAERGASSE